MLKLFEWFQHNWFVVAVNSSVVSASMLEILHYASFFLLVGSMIIIDLRILGLAGRRVPVEKLARQLFPWIWTGFCLAVISGFLMFAVEATNYLHNSVFHEKLYMTLLTVVFAILIQWNVKKWGELPNVPALGKLFAVLSIASCVGTILMGVNVPALTGVG